METPLFSVMWFLVMFLAAVVAWFVRQLDYPSLKWKEAEIKELVIGFFVVLVASILGAWFLTERGMMIGDFYNFVLLVAFAMTGIAGIRGLLEAVKKLFPGLLPEPPPEE
jgi:hypothetical protein